MAVSIGIMSEVTVHVGGHVTLLFSVNSKQLLARNQGSKGAGFCLEDGVESTVRILNQGEDRVSVRTMDGELFVEGNKLYIELLKSFRNVFKIQSPVEIDVKLELPISQGFGMSAAGLLATSLALGELFDRGDEGQLARLAHRIERNISGGLGDILGLWAGGCELRTIPGSPPIPGQAVGFSADAPALLVWDPDGKKHTSSYINDADWQVKISNAGESAVERLKKYNWDSSIWNTLLDEADKFAMQSGLLEEVERANLFSTVIENTDESLSPHLCMLGTSLIIVPTQLGQEPDYSEIAATLRSFGLGVRETRIQ